MAGTNENVALLARSGYAARGVVYLIVGGLAGLAALEGGQTTDARGALTTLLAQPFGNALLAIVALGLVCYAFGARCRRLRTPITTAPPARGCPSVVALW